MRPLLLQHPGQLIRSDSSLPAWSYLHLLSVLSHSCLPTAGLILLEPELRRHVKRCFTAAAKALESIASPLHRLRTQLHLECAKCEAADDALIKV